MADPSDRTRSNLQVRGAGRTGRSTVAARRRLLTVVLVGVVLVDVAAALAVQARVEAAIRQRVVSLMRSSLDSEATSAERWFTTRVEVVSALTLQDDVRAPALTLLRNPADVEAARQALAAVDISTAVFSHGRLRALVVDATGRVVANQLGLASDELDASVLDELKATSPPKARVLLPRRTKDGLQAGWAVAPFVDGGALLGWLLVPIKPADFVSGPFASRKVLETGELYAYGRDGVMLSESRFPETLRQAGLLSPDDTSTVLTVDLRDPGVDLTTGARPAALRRELPLTKPAAAAGQSGEDFEGYHDYRGIDVYGAWRWFDEYGFGLVMEVDEAEALGPLTLMQPLFVGFDIAVGLLLAGAAWSYLRYRAAKQKLEALSDEAERLGQYKLVRKLGEGGMGVVYEAQHALLQRPAAIKLMQPGTFTTEQAARFEREVQVTASLTHPNTVSIFDFGKSEDGTFYYVMELLSGCDLEQLVLRTGPMPVSRAVHVLRQVCGSLAEAHLHGLVHRDVKPANIYLTARAGVYDVAKLLDFGLVRTSDAKAAGLTNTQLIMGTPLYMAPELFEGASHASPASDIYAVGAVAYWLVTGQPVFDDRKSLPDLMMDHRSARPRPVAEVLGKPVDAALEAVITACLQKDPKARPASMEALLAMLDDVPGAWRDSEARAWWDANGRGLGQEPAAPDESLAGPTVRRG